MSHKRVPDFKIKVQCELLETYFIVKAICGHNKAEIRQNETLKYQLVGGVVAPWCNPLTLQPE